MLSKSNPLTRKLFRLKSLLVTKARVDRTEVIASLHVVLLQTFPLRPRIAVLIPITSPFISNKGPPEFPEFIEASV